MAQCGEKQMRIYYAHPMSWYNTDEEEKDMVFLRSQYPNATIVNPNSEFFQQAVEDAKDRNLPVMEVFANYIRDETDLVIARSFQDNKWGAGVGREIFEAFIHGKPVLRIATSRMFGRYTTPIIGEDFFGQLATLAETRRRVHETGEL